MRARTERGQTVVRAVLLVAAVALIGVLLYRQVSRLGGNRVPVWVAAVDLRPGQMVTPGLMKLTQAPPPKGALVEQLGIVGRQLKVAKVAGQPFYNADLEPRPVPPALASTIPVGRLMATVKVAALDLPTQELRQGDRLDIIQAGPDGVTMVAHDAFMMGNLSSQPKARDGSRVMGVDISPPTDAPASPAEALVLGVFPEDVFPLAAAEASGHKLKIVLHSDTEVKSGVLLTPDPPRPAAPGEGLPAVEIITGKTKETIYVRDEVRNITILPPVRPQATPRTGAQ
jgi:Flp pilus assembly protein CpaB